MSATGHKDIVRLPGVNNADVTLFKRVPFGDGRRHFQLRWEIYNVFNHTQFNGVNTTATFNATGQQVNATVRAGHQHAVAADHAGVGEGGVLTNGKWQMANGKWQRVKGKASERW